MPLPDRCFLCQKPRLLYQVEYWLSSDICTAIHHIVQSMTACISNSLYHIDYTTSRLGKYIMSTQPWNNLMIHFSAHSPLLSDENPEPILSLVPSVLSFKWEYPHEKTPFAHQINPNSIVQDLELQKKLDVDFRVLVLKYSGVAISSYFPFLLLLFPLFTSELF